MFDAEFTRIKKSLGNSIAHGPSCSNCGRTRQHTRIFPDEKKKVGWQKGKKFASDQKHMKNNRLPFTPNRSLKSFLLSFRIDDS